MSVYKKLTAQDINISPFYVNKQYSFTSASAATSSIGVFEASFTSESIHAFSSGAGGGSSSLDDLNTIKYNQIDHLFYKNYKRDVSTKMGSIKNLRNHKRSIYKQIYVVSMPSGLTGNGIKPTTLHLSSSQGLNGFNQFKITDDGFGNLYKSGSDLNVSYSLDIRNNIFNLGPELGFRRYDLSVINDNKEATTYYRRGKKILNNIPVSYNTPGFGDEYDDSHYFNLIKYNNIKFTPVTLQYKRGEFSKVDFANTPTTSSISMYHNELIDFNTYDDFTISFWLLLPAGVRKHKRTLIQKSGLQTIVPTPNQSRTGTPISTKTTGVLQPLDISAGPRYPFKIYVSESNDSTVGGGKGVCFHFERSNGESTHKVLTYANREYQETGSMQHVTCRYSGSKMSIWLQGKKAIESTSTLSGITRNDANLYIGGVSDSTKEHEPFNGSMSQINIYNKPLTDLQILHHFSSSNSSPYIGNCFHSNGLAVLTHPDFVDGTKTNGIHSLKFQNTHLIHQNEYLCSIDEHEFTTTRNTSARKTKSSNDQNLSDFTTSSLFQPYVTTVGLYNEDNELLVVGKLGQPIRMSTDTDTTFAIRWDT